MQSFADSGNGDVFFIRLKGIIVSLFKHKICRDMIFNKNNGIYTKNTKQST